MTPKDKARELVEKYSFLKNCFIPSIHEQKQCALIAVDEIINCDSFFKTLEDSKEFTEYWYEVKQEIEKL